MTNTNVPLIGQEKKETSPVTEASTAFLVAVLKDGSVMLTPDINMPLTVDHQPTLPELKGALFNVLSDITKEETAVSAAQQVVGLQMSLSRQLAEQQAAQRTLGKLNLGN